MTINQIMKKILLLLSILILLFLTNIFVGSIDIPFAETFDILTGGTSSKMSWQYIILSTRLPQSVTALLAGAALSICGLMLQTVFRNPLADTSIFGVSSGAGLGVALVVLFLGGTIGIDNFSLTGFAAIFFGAFIGAMSVIGIVFFFSTLVRSHVLLLIIGIMIGYISSSIISLLNFFATEHGVKSYFVWGMGNFGGVSQEHLPVFTSLCIIGIIGAVLMIKPLNIMLLGDNYAANLGISITIVRNSLLVVTGLLTAVVTAFCGPISFIGLAVPHISRLLVRTDNHAVLVPLTMITGSITALLCNMLCVLPSANSIIPLNAITPLIGAPVIIYIICKNRQ